jgi:hypothetical protein
MTTFTQAQKIQIDNQLRQNRADIVDTINEVEQGSDKWFSLKEAEMKISNLLMFASYEERNKTAQVVI